MKTVRTFYERPDEWFQDTYICCECDMEFMTDDTPRFCPYCGVEFDAVRIQYPQSWGGRTETIFINNEQEDKE